MALLIGNKKELPGAGYRGIQNTVAGCRENKYSYGFKSLHGTSRSGSVGDRIKVISKNKNA